MSTPTKIDMSALTKKQDEINSTPPASEEQFTPETKTEVVETETMEKEVESKIPRISLGSIKTNKSVETKEEIEEDQEEDQHDDKKDELMEVLNRKTEPVKAEPVKAEPVKAEPVKAEPVKAEPVKAEPVKTEPVKTEPVENEKDISEIEKEIDKKVEEETNKKFKIQDEEIEKKDNKKELFGNYETDYKEKTVMEKIKEEKKKIKQRFTKPKTRLFVVVSLLILLISVIGGLFIFDPDNHSLDIYKNRIAANINNIKSKYIDKPWVPATIDVDTITFDIKTREKLLKIIYPGSTLNYKYNEIIYKTKDELEIVLKKEAKIKKEEIARQEAEIARQEAEQKRIEAERQAEIALTEKKEKVKTIIREVLLEKFR